MDGDWFKEQHVDVCGQHLALEVEKVLFHEKSPYQDILIFQSKSCGRVMVLDGIIHSTERDEHAYHEMISFLPLNAHPDPKKVLIIGGGDGGVACKCAKHPNVIDITMIEIDQVVIDASKRYLPHIACGSSHPKVTLHVTDGLDFLKTNSTKYDVIIVDISGEGQTAELFTKLYYKHMKDRLKPGGIVCTQGQSVWTDLKSISEVLSFCKELFPSVSYAASSLPSYTSGSSGYVICGVEEGMVFKEPLLDFTEEEKEDMQLRFYNEDIHRGAFALPRFVKQQLML